MTAAIKLRPPSARRPLRPMPPIRITYNPGDSLVALRQAASTESLTHAVTSAAWPDEADCQQQYDPILFDPRTEPW